MTPSEKYGEEFVFHRFTVPHRDGHLITCREAAVCIVPKEDRESTLAFGWQIVREVAQWLIASFDTVRDDEAFRIILAWSRSVRPHQGHIFKVWGYKERIRTIAASPAYADYAKAVGDNWVPMPGWEKNLFDPETGRLRQASLPTTGREGMPGK